MIQSLFDILTQIDQFFWGYVAFTLIMIFGGYLTYAMRFFQIRALPSIIRTFVHIIKTKNTGLRGIHPLTLFFASVGGMVGIGNIVGIVTALQLGGPGALFWTWVAALIGSTIKYSEIILGVKYRVPNDHGGYDGGPVYFLKAAFKNRFIPLAAAMLLCIYGVEIYQFSVVTESLSSNWNVNRYLIVVLFLALVMYAGMGGVKRIGKICSTIMPFFLISYLFMSLWILFQEAHLLPDLLQSVFRSAFSGHAALGGFVGSSTLLSIQQGTARAAYSSDIGIGYDSIIQSESNMAYPEKQASLAILGIFVDNLICTMSILVVLVSGVWTATPAFEASQLAQTALSKYFPSMQFFMPFFLLILGYTTIITYFCVGLKCARFVFPKHGQKIYYGYALVAFVFFSFFDQTHALLMMSLSGALLLSCNLLGIFRLRHEVLAKGRSGFGSFLKEPKPSMEKNF